MESPLISMRSIGSIWKATLRAMALLIGPKAKSPKDRQTGKALAIKRGQVQGAASTTSKAMSWPAKPG